VVKIFLFALSVFFISSAIAQPANVSFTPYEQAIPGSPHKTKMVTIPAGSFTIGSGDNEKGRNADEGPQRKVSVSAFWMGAHEVTHDEFDVFFKDETTSQNDGVDAVTRPSSQYIDLSWGMGREGGFPVNSMSQKAALMYCRWLYNKTGIFYRLPTEAEWEYACRAGKETPYFFGTDDKEINDYAWFKSNSEDKYHKTGLKKPNPWGLYDILGNVMEWTLDHYDEKTFEKLPESASDPVNTNENKYPKVLKGGGYDTGYVVHRGLNRTRNGTSGIRRYPGVSGGLQTLLLLVLELYGQLSSPRRRKLKTFLNSI
jgi:formylglycine-generating enzyme required for sulfatase activity